MYELCDWCIVDEVSNVFQWRVMFWAKQAKHDPPLKHIVQYFFDWCIVDDVSNVFQWRVMFGAKQAKHDPPLKYIVQNRELSPIRNHHIRNIQRSPVDGGVEHTVGRVTPCMTVVERLFAGMSAWGGGWIHGWWGGSRFDFFAWSLISAIRIMVCLDRQEIS